LAGLFWVGLLVLGVGIYLAVRENTRAFGVPFLISFALGFVVLAGICVSFLRAVHVG